MSVMIYNTLLKKGVINTEGTITLNKKEQRTNDIIVKLLNKEINIGQASRLSGLCERQLYRKSKAYKEKGINSIPHKLKSNPSKTGYSKEFKNNIISLYKDEYCGWNFYHFNDTLEDEHNIKVSDTFIYNLLSSEGIKSPCCYKKRKKESHPPRERREKAGELEQMDATKFKWFYGDNKYYHLHAAIDDATGIVTGAFFQKEETTYGYQIVLAQMLKNYGLPECLYTDYRTIFASTKKELTIEEELAGKVIKTPRFIKMLETLGISNIPTYNPMAKGRIERLWKTFQSRLYNEMKKKNIKSIEEANLFLLEFIPKYNARFALQIDDTKNVFICLDDNFDYNMALSTYEEYSVHRYCYLSYKGSYLIILEWDDKPAYISIKTKVKVITMLDQTIVVEHNGVIYNTKPILSIPKDQIVEDKNEAVQTTTSKYNGSPWRSSLPKMPSQRCMQHAFFNGC
jgi:transposase